MDAFSVSLANGLNEPNMRSGKILLTAGVFAFFQALMPMTGWLLVHTAVKHITGFGAFIPWIALILLTFVGGNMIYEGVRGGSGSSGGTGIAVLLVQGIATSIDALSTGFAIADYGLAEAAAASALIALVTLILCIIGIIIGRKAGTVLAGKAQILGGIILICIGVEIFAGSFSI